MEIPGWEDRYRSRERPMENLNAAPTQLLIETAQRLQPGRALDLACGTGRNAFWLAEHGWTVTAVDGASAAIEILRKRTAERGIALDARVADLEKGQYRIEQSTWDLIAMCYYLQRNLFEPAKRGVVSGGVVLAIVHINELGEEQASHRLKPGELKSFFQEWEILHFGEGKPSDTGHQRSVAQIAARRPIGW
jgi:SAM-dependent methyltransferase